VRFSDLELAVSQTSRKYGHVRNNILDVWIPRGGRTQQKYSRELAGALLFEAEEFFDRALVLYLLRSHLRDLQASTWGGVSTYYANYFLALSFSRLHMRSVTHIPNGPIFEITAANGQMFFRIQERADRQKHAEVWRTYYEIVKHMGWPDAATTNDIAPSLDSMRFREQQYRERINYRPGEGFEEIYLMRTRYLKSLQAELADDGGNPQLLHDAAYTDRMASKRLHHVAALLHRLSASRPDVDVEASMWYRRMELIRKYARSQGEIRAATALIGGTSKLA
jgi:hypothetical protein